MLGEYEGLVELAWDRYHNEPLFHARVYHAVAAVRFQAKADGFTWPEQFDGILTATAATALLLSEIHDPDTGEFNEMAGDSGRTDRRIEQPPGPEQADPDKLNGLRSPPAHLRKYQKPADPS